MPLGGTSSPKNREVTVLLQEMQHPPATAMDQRSNSGTSAVSSGTVPPTPEGAPPPTARPQAFRRPHHKSRLGCVQCKQRKIKCDENKPSCDKCVRYNTPCSFLTLQPNRPSDRPKTSPHSTPGLQSSQNSSRTSPYPSPASASLNAAPPEEIFTMEDLEFLHHYTTHTWHTISSLAFWQTHVPQIATTYPFLMHGILALSARHLASLSPSRSAQLIHLSGQHHQKALTGYSRELAHITRENCHACAAFSLLLNVYAWGGGNTLFMSEPSPSSSPRLGPENEVELIAVLRGGNSVMAQAKHWVVEGPLAPLYRPWFGFNKDPDGFTRLPSVQSLLGRSEDGDRLQQPILPHEDDARLEQLARLWSPRAHSQTPHGYPSPVPHTTHGGPSPISPTSHASPYSQPPHYNFPPELTDSARGVLDHTLHMLRRVFVVVTTNEIIEPQAATLSWPIIIPDVYIQMISQRNPHALVLLAHYTVLLKRNEERWWIKDKAEELLQKIVLELQRLPDGPQWMEWIQWPLGEVGQRRPSKEHSMSHTISREHSMSMSVKSEHSPMGFHSHDTSRTHSQVTTPQSYQQESIPMGGMEERMHDPRMSEARMK